MTVDNWDFSFEATNDVSGRLSDYKGQWVVLYFYPRDATPGCTTQGQDFRDMHAKFQDLNTVILGISRDTLKSHERFKEKQGFPFELIADPEETICLQYDVMKDKNMYGKKVRGIERSTFIFNPEGEMVQEWRKVKVPGHVTEVLQWIEDQK